MLIGGLELLFLLMLGEIPAVGALYSGLGLEIFAGIPFFTGFTLKTTLLLCHVGIGCAAIGFLLTAKITEYTSATEASFVYLVKPDSGNGAGGRRVPRAYQREPHGRHRVLCWRHRCVSACRC